MVLYTCCLLWRAFWKPRRQMLRNFSFKEDFFDRLVNIFSSGSDVPMLELSPSGVLNGIDAIFEACQRNVAGNPLCELQNKTQRAPGVEKILGFKMLEELQKPPFETEIQQEILSTSSFQNLHVRVSDVITVTKSSGWKLTDPNLTQSSLYCPLFIPFKLDLKAILIIIYALFWYLGGRQGVLDERNTIGITASPPPGTPPQGNHSMANTDR